MNERRKRTNDRTASTTGTTALATTGATAAVPTGRIDVPPAGLFSRSLLFDADVSDELADLAPTFADVLLSIGSGVAGAQSALDQGFVQSAQTLSNTKIEVITDVIQQLNDDGLPVANQTELISSEVALINFLSPTVHEWKHVALQMDLSVGETDRETGFSFTQSQHSTSVTATGLFWGFLGWFDHESSRSFQSRDVETNRETDWARGQVRVDAMLGPRRTEKFSAPAQVTIGPRIYFSFGSVQEAQTDGVVTSRSLDMIITVRKADGSVNALVNIEIDADRFAYSFATGGDFTGSTTNTDGQVKVTFTRQIPNARFLRPVRDRVVATLGQVTQSTEVTL